MKSAARSVLFLVMLFVAAQGFAGDVTQMWSCELDDDATEEQVVAHAAEWLEAAKKVDGGANFQAYIFFPVAVNAMGEMDILFVVSAPSFTEWGTFWDNYPGSPAAEIEKAGYDMVVCPDSVLWEKVKVE
jgi:hypothetical protein